MVYTEIQKRNNRKYYYRVISVRNKNKVLKKRKYLGVNLSAKELNEKEKNIDKEFNFKKNIVKNIKKNVINKLKPKIIKVLKKYKIKKAGIFGSYVKGKQKKNSDIDIIVEPPKGIGFKFTEIQFELEKETGKKIDIVTYKYLSPYLKKDILKEEVRII